MARGPAQILIAVALRAANAGASADAALVCELDAACQAARRAGVPEADHAEAVLFHASERWCERGPTRNTTAALKAAVHLAVEARTEAAPPASAERRAEYWYGELMG